MQKNYVEDIRNEFRRLKRKNRVTNGTYEIRNAQFKVDHPIIFGDRNEEYIAAEIEWYESQSLNVNDLFKIYGKEVAIWKQVATKEGHINSNYGWCIYSPDNGNQYKEVANALRNDPTTRRGTMVYTRPTMHRHYNVGGRNDFMCTCYVQYSIVGGDSLEVSVHMRSNDAIYGFLNDVAWQRHVQTKLADDLDLYIGPITWNADSLHIYERHWGLIE